MAEPDDYVRTQTIPSTAPLVTPPELDPFSQLFWRANGLRAGWRLLIFSVICGGILAVVHFASVGMHHAGPSGNQFTPGVLLVGELIVFGAVLFASWIMSKIEGRTIGDYGLPFRRAFRSEFWTGVAIGFLAISFLLGALGAARVFHLGEASLHGMELLRYAGLWGCTLLAVAFFEEYAFRGYALFTLATGITFWPAALVFSVAFGCVHLSNSGETWLGAFSAGAIGFLFCLMLRRTGNLWMPIGFHSAWDWGETFFYGVPDSGQVTPGHLFNATFSGPVWLTGGTVGPEASWLCILLIAVLLVIFSVSLRGVKYPSPASVRDPRHSP